MSQAISSELQEPLIRREDVLIIPDKYFQAKNVAVVTGAASGVGRATAIALAVNGLTVIGLDIDETRGRETGDMAKALGGKTLFVKTDLTKDLCPSGARGSEIRTAGHAALRDPGRHHCVHLCHARCHGPGLGHGVGGRLSR